MSVLDRFDSRRMADAYANLVWQATDDEREVVDCHVARVGGEYVLKVTCDTPSGMSVHVLKSPKAFERFLDPPERSDTTGWADVESWDADMGL